MTALRYPPHTLVADYIRSGAGVAVSVGVLATNPINWTLGLVFGGVLLLFGGFGVRTIRHHVLRLNLAAEGITRRGPMGGRTLSWADLRGVKLRYFGTRKQDMSEGQRNTGFLQLTLTTPEGRMRFESNLENFDYLVWRAAKAARDAGIGLDPTTAENMLAIHIDPDGETRPPESVRALAAKVDGLQV